jgi:hypothetical protein
MLLGEYLDSPKRFARREKSESRFAERRPVVPQDAGYRL